MFIINLTEEQRKGNYSLLSDTLCDNIKKTLQNKQKIVLFYNRKGYAKRIQCKDCKHIFTCEKCNLPLSVKEAPDHAFFCPYCQFTAIAPNCQNCKGTNFKFLSYGLVKVKQDIIKKFGASDLDSFIFATEPQSLDPLSKGGDIALGALLNADTDLYIPNFSANVQTFNRIQKFKKYCRELSVPIVIIQTYAPSYFAIAYCVSQDEESFKNEELKKRKILNYPPYGQLIKLVYQHKDKNKCRVEAQQLYQYLNRKWKIGNWKFTEITPPQPAWIPKVRGNYRYQMIIKNYELRINNYEYGMTNYELNPEIKAVLLSLPPAWIIDVDPISTL